MPGEEKDRSYRKANDCIPYDHHLQSSSSLRKMLTLSAGSSRSAVTSTTGTRMRISK